MLKKIIIMICILSGIVQAADIQVGCRDCDYSSIQEAIDHSKEGDRIEVFSGVYPNDIIINVDNISLIGVDTGNGKPVIYANSVNIQPIPCSDIRGLKGASVQINGDNVTLKNFNIIKKPTPNSGDIIYFGLAVTSKGNIITDNEISNYTFGILLCRSSNNLICKNKIKDNKKMGIHLANSSKNVIVCNGVEGSDHNIDLDDKSLSNLIYFNYLDNPGKFNAYDPGKFNSNLWNNSTIGNFYSHFECISDCSGICSNEYKIPPGSNVDKHPVSNDILSSQKLFICQPLHCLNFTVKANCSSARVGETIGYTIDVSNCGRSQLKYIRLYDEKIGLVSYLSGLNSGEARKIESPYTHKVNESDLPGPFNIKFNATYFCVSCGEYKTDHAEDQVPLVNVVFNKTPDLEMAHVGDRINYGYDIINKGSAELHNLSIWDNKTGNFTPVRTTLGEGETTHANSVYTVKKMDCPAVINEAILYYQDRENKNRSISANASVPTIKNISISISKKANRTLAEVGDNITYYYEIRNTGNVTFNNLTLNDSKIDGVVPKNRTLKPNESTTAEANYLVLEEDLPVLINEATARGWDNSGREANDTNSTRVDLIKVVFNKTPDLEMAHVGDRVNYGYDIINKGSTELHNLSIWDNKTGTFAPVRTTLGEGETTHANSVYSAKETDCPAVTNEAILYYLDRENKNRSISANASVPVSSCDTINISLSKKADKKLAEVGDKITYYYEIRNTGKVTLNNLTLNDSKMNEIVPKTRTLKPNESTTVEANYVVLERDLPVLINHATVWGWDNSEREANDTNSTRVDLIKVVFNKTPDLEMAHIGDRINYGYDIINKGSAELHNLSIWDNKTGNFTPARTTLGEGETTHANSVYTVKKTDCPAVINEAILYYQDRENKNRSISANASVPTIEKNSISLSKKANRTLAEVGDNITYYYEIRNTGNVTFNNLTLNDSKIDGVVPKNRTLKPNESTTAEANYLVLEEDLPVLINEATARGWDNSGQEANDTNSTRVDLIKVVFNKTSDLEMAHVGDRINYGYDIINKGSAELHNLSIWDNKTGTFAPVRTTLGEGETTHANSVYTAKETDCPAVTNEAILYYQDRENKNRSISANASVPTIEKNSISLSKKANRTLAEVGDNITYYYEIRNTGKVTLNNLTLNDNKIGEIDLGIRTLKPNEFTTANATYVVLEEDLPVLINNATARGWDAGEREANDSDSARVDLVKVVFNKTPDRNQVCVGDAINYTFRIKNAGSVPITLLNLFDDLIGDIPINKTVLASNESLEAKAADRAEKAGYLNNTATLEFLDPDGRAGRATASASVDANCVTFLKEASVDTADVGQTIIYNFTIINKLSLPIKDLAITDGLTGPVHLDKNTLQTAETAKGTASYTVKSGDLPGPLVNKATFTAYDYWNEKITVYAAAKVILNSSDLQISKNGPKEPITTDDMINYAITVTNNGPSLARNVRVKDIVPANSILQSVTPSGYDQTTGIWSIGDLDKGQSFVMRMTLKPFSPGSVINAAGVYSETFDPYPANNESTAVVIVLPGPCGQNCFDCSASQTNYVNVTSHGQNIQVFSNGPATISNISQKMKNSANN